MEMVFKNAADSLTLKKQIMWTPKETQRQRGLSDPSLSVNGLFILKKE